MKALAAAALLVTQALAQGPYQPTRAALAARPTPGWFTDARFGVFIVWGPYSVPAWAPKGKYAEWYGYRVETARAKNDMADAWLAHHSLVYGVDFPYQGFVDRFRAEAFDAGAWAKLIADSGARYVVHSAKYHDGFAMWPSADASRSWGKPWNSAEAGPKRDLVGDLDQALRRRGIRSGLYYSIYEWFNPLYLKDWRKYRDEHLFPQFKDMVNRYKPDIVWLDGQWDHTFDEWRSGELAAWLFNESPVKDAVAVNDRWGGRRAMADTSGEPVVGYRTSEYESGFDAAAGPWEENRGMGGSYGYNRNEDIQDYRSGQQLIRLLVEVASRGGNLLLDIGPSADGRIPVIMQERLLEMGAWLKENGEAIYGTSAGPVQQPGALTGAAKPDHAMTPAEEAKQAKERKWATTARPGKIYLHLFEWPANGKITVPISSRSVNAARMLAGGPDLKLGHEGPNVRITLPARQTDLMPAVVVLDSPEP
ncbi:MAG: alpha-L-fucosidase [Acidobacteria bacterium]|nr:alpha-L-fucosidase [Acidobacteriota bacterium]